MRRIVYAGETLLTSDEVAAAVLSYAASLARAGAAETVVVPGVDEQGRPTEVELLVGPASQMASEPVDVDFEVSAAEFLDDLSQRTSSRARPLGLPDDPELRFYDGL